MTRLILALLVLAVWVALTAVAAWAVPQRHDPDALPDLVFDPHLALGTPPNPVVEDKVTRRVTATTTTSTAPVTPAAARTTRPRPPPSTPSGDGCGGWRPLVATYAWNVDTACRILLCESGGRPDAVGVQTRYGTAKGLMQVMGYGSFDPATNMAQAWAKYQAAIAAGRSGWAPWTCR